MLFRLVRPMKRKGSQNQQFARRIPADLRLRLVGRRLEVPLGDGFATVRISESTSLIRFSLRTGEP